MYNMMCYNISGPNLCYGSFLLPLFQFFRLNRANMFIQSSALYGSLFKDPICNIQWGKKLYVFSCIKSLKTSNCCIFIH